MQLFFEHQKRSARRVTASNTNFDRKTRLEITKKFSNIEGDVRTLCKQGRLKEAVDTVDLLDGKDIQVYSNTCLFLLQTCINLKALTQARHVYANMTKSGFKPDMFLETALIDMLAKSGNISDACNVFLEMSKRDLVTWNVMIAGHVDHGDPKHAFKLFSVMEKDGIITDEVTFMSIIKACSKLGNVELGKRIHELLIRRGIKQDLLLRNTLIDMYAKCGSMEDAYRIFQNMPVRSVVSWTAIIAGHSKHGNDGKALELFLQMQKEGVKPDEVVFLSVLNACASLGNLEQGQQIHGHAIRSGVKLNTCLASALIDLYAKCGSMESAYQVFDELHKRDLVSWTALIAGYVNLGHSKEALKCFWQMQQEGVKPNEITFLSILSACASRAALNEAKQIHDCIIRSEIKPCILMESTLIDTYAKCGCMTSAHQVFDQMHEQDSVSWNALIAGYNRQENAEEAFRIFQLMEQKGIEADKGTFVNLLKSCTSMGALERGNEIHMHIIKSGFDSDALVRSAVIDMYAKCGKIKSAWWVLDNMPKRDVVVWTAMMTGYAQHGHHEEALKLVEKMHEEGVKLNNVTFLGILSACSHAGLVDSGYRIFEWMSKKHGIMPRVEHYTCMIDLLGRAGRFEEAECVIKQMACQPTAVVGLALLGPCRVYGHVELAERMADYVLCLEPENTSAYTLLAYTYAAHDKVMD